MPRLRTYEIANAMYGSTQLSAVYMGNTQIWAATPDPVLTITSGRWVRNGAGGCTRGNRYEVYITGIHNIEDTEREIVTQYLNSQGSWIGDADAYYLDVFTQPNVNFDLRTFQYICVTNSSGSPTVRMRYKLSDGTITEWATWSPTKEEESEIENG